MAPWVEDDPSATITPSMPWLTALSRCGIANGAAFAVLGQAGAARADATGDNNSASPNRADSKPGATVRMTGFNYMRAAMSARLKRSVLVPFPLFSGTPLARGGCVLAARPDLLGVRPHHRVIVVVP